MYRAELLVAGWLILGSPPATAEEGAPEQQQSELQQRELQHIELQQIERGFTQQPGPKWQAQAEALVARWPHSDAAGRALLWLGGVALQSHHYDAAQAYFAQAQERFAGGELGALAARGLGDIDYYSRRWSDAVAHYDLALQQRPSPLLASELREKRAAAIREWRRFLIEAAAWLWALACAAWFALSFGGSNRSIPLETRLLLPVYVLLIAIAWGREMNVTYALIYLAVGSLALVTLACGGAAKSRRRAFLDGGLLLIANIAVGYIALRRAGIIDVLWETMKAGTDIG